ncbi:acetyltransferase [Alphaproteobacteria bacterium]|nr:acetyltransferase [Alphaproteobacteria bacterium]
MAPKNNYIKVAKEHEFVCQFDKVLCIFGAGGHAISVANVALASGYKDIVFVSADRSENELLGFPVKNNKQLMDHGQVRAVAIAIGDNYKRSIITKTVTDQHKLCFFPTLIHPSAVISEGCRIGHGTVVMPNAVVGPCSKVGNFVIVNTAASLDHNTETADFVSIAPNATLGGDVTIGKYSAIGIGATISHSIQIKENVVVGGASFVNRDTDPNTLIYGVPARPIRLRRLGEEYLG